jgi:hypothetical protein
MEPLQEVQMITKDNVAAAFRYTPEDGRLWWVDYVRRPSWNGREAGNNTPNGYRKIKFRGRQLLTHRVAWLLHYGVWPSGDIDHIDGDPLNNRIDNLRDVSHRVNMQNQVHAQARNPDRLVGATKKKGKWMAQININGKSKYLGLFATAQEAHEVYLNAAKGST